MLPETFCAITVSAKLFLPQGRGEGWEVSPDESCFTTYRVCVSVCVCLCVCVSVCLCVCVLSCSVLSDSHGL